MDDVLKSVAAKSIGTHVSHVEFLSDGDNLWLRGGQDLTVKEFGLKDGDEIIVVDAMEDPED